jgi:hypothetical protein
VESQIPFLIKPFDSLLFSACILNMIYNEELAKFDCLYFEKSTLKKNFASYFMGKMWVKPKDKVQM